MTQQDLQQILDDLNQEIANDNIGEFFTKEQDGLCLVCWKRANDDVELLEGDNWRECFLGILLLGLSEMLEMAKSK